MKVLNRIKASSEFAETIKKGKSIRTESFILHYANSGKEYTRVGVSVSVKIGNAVIRNRVKRQIRAMCDSLIDYASHTFDIVIVAKDGMTRLDYQQNLQILKITLSKIGILQ